MSFTRGQLVSVLSGNKMQWARYDATQAQVFRGTTKSYSKITGHWVYRIFVGPEGRIYPEKGAITLAYDPRKKKWVYARLDGRKQEVAKGTTGHYLQSKSHIRDCRCRLTYVVRVNLAGHREQDFVCERVGALPLWARIRASGSWGVDGIAEEAGGPCSAEGDIFKLLDFHKRR
ncbi:hypothetical protein B0H14DRAFT_2697621 [Mycena olivaceomarginata]|nr:hypothetical protein B0H14DRAFT_2697621 [Mycena olivaceomarginata]